MANVNNPFGLNPLMRDATGGPSGIEDYVIESGYAQAIYKNDPVTELAGVLNGPASGITPGTTLYRGVATDYNPASTGRGGTASLNPPMGVIDSPQAIFECQEDNSGGANVVQAKMGYNANLTTTAGDSTLKRSKVQVSGTSIAATGTLDVRIRRLVKDPTNAYGAYGRLEVMFNKHLGNFGVTPT